MTLPIDEMVTELRYALEAFEDNPCDETFNKVQYETARIQCACEDVLVEEDEE